jgi:hypothetical protein
VCRYQALADGQARLRTVADALTQAGATVGGVSIPTMNRQMEHVAAVAQMFADGRSQTDRAGGRAT